MYDCAWSVHALSSMPCCQMDGMPYRKFWKGCKGCAHEESMPMHVIFACMLLLIKLVKDV